MKPYVARKEVDWTPWDTEEPGEAVREDLYDDEWSDEEDEVFPLETVQDKEDEVDDDDVRYMLGSELDEDEEGSDEENEDEEEEEDVHGRRRELPPSRFGRRRWAPSRLAMN